MKQKSEAPFPTPNLIAAIKASGATDKERAERLGVTVNTIRAYYRRGKLPPLALVLARPNLLEACAADVAAHSHNPATGD